MSKSNVIDYAERKINRERQPGNGGHPAAVPLPPRGEHHPVPWSGNTTAAGHGKPNGLSAILLNRGITSLVVDKIDPAVPELSLLSPAMFEKIVFVQEAHDPCRLYGLLVCKTLMVLVRCGSLCLVPETPGRAVLDSFGDWLERTGIGDRELRFALPGTYELVEEQSVVNSLWLDAESDPRLQRHFDAWNRRGR